MAYLSENDFFGEKNLTGRSIQITPTVWFLPCGAVSDDPEVVLSLVPARSRAVSFWRGWMLGKAAI